MSGAAAMLLLALAGPARAQEDAAPALPLVVIMTPPAGAVVTGTTTVSANASAGAGVVSVQFLLDGVDLSPPLSAPPYTIVWNTAASGDGMHALAAVARDGAGRAETSPIVRVTSDNVPPAIDAVSASGVGADGAYIRWTTSEPADSRVEYGMTEEYGESTPLSSSRVLERGVALTGLASEALYHYRVWSRDAAGLVAVSPDHVFATAEPAPGASTAAAAGPAAAALSAKAPQKFLSPARADGINDEAVFGPDAREVTIVDARGRRVFRETSSGPPIRWNVKDPSGRVVPSGAYIAVITTRDSSRVYQTFAVVK
ncbi:MAG: Ig-like domain-containing protein [Elusimicrobiota bacterium]|nr:Ig-like domain-containing protein [Elusimicrobiota bacterium]